MAHRRVDAGQRLPHGLQQLHAGGGQLHRAGVAQKQGHAHLVFQRLDLPADGRLRQRHFLGRHAEIEMPGHRLERAQVACLHGAGTQMGL